MIIEDHSHEVEKVEHIRPPFTTSLETLRSCDPELPPPYYDPTIPLLGRQYSQRINIKGFVCWLAGLMVAFGMVLVSLPRIQLSSPNRTPKLPDVDRSPSSSTSIVASRPESTQPSSTQRPIDPYPTSVPHRSSCISSQLWSHHGSVSSTSVQLPLDSEVLRFDKLGSHAEGTISFTSLPVGFGSFINVEILAYHLDNDVLDRAGICVRRGEEHGIHGVTLLTNVSDTHPASPVKYDVKIYLPGSSTYMPGRPRHYNRLETDLLDFRHEIQLPAEYIEFQSVDLRSSMARMSVPALSAQDISIKTTQFPINGYFDVGSALALETDLSRIEASVKLHAQRGGGTTSLSMKTTEGATWAQVRCLPNLLHLGDFQITSLNTNATSLITVPSLPFGAGLNIDARSTAEKVEVQLPPTFEGNFDLASPPILNPNRTNIFVDYDEDARDPQGLGRLRHVDVTTAGFRLRGTAVWRSLLNLPRPRSKNLITMRSTGDGMKILKF